MLSNCTIKTTPKGGTGSIIAINAPDIKGKIEGQKFIWITKPIIKGNHTKGNLCLNFFNDEGIYIGGVYEKYELVKEDSYTGFDFANASWDEAHKSE